MRMSLTTMRLSERSVNTLKQQNKDTTLDLAFSYFISKIKYLKVMITHLNKNEAYRI